MSMFSQLELKRLLDLSESPCTSIYLPTHQKGAQTQQDSIRFKNLLRDAENQLAAFGLTPEQIKAQFKSAWQLVDHYDFWQHQDQGLAVFITSKHCLTYRLPLSFESRAVVSHQFYIRPLLPLLSTEGTYFVLAASQNQVRFFEATRDRIEQIELVSLPQSLDEALRYDDPEQQLQYHQAGSTIYHGQGNGADSENTDLLRFFHKVDQGIQERLNSANAPLIFMGVDYLFPIFKEACSYPHVCDSAISTNPDQLLPKDIHQRTWAIAEPIFKQSMESALKVYADQMETNQTVSDLLDVLIAAHDGQIDTLFIPHDKSVWGRFDAAQRRLDTESEKGIEKEELFNLAAIYTLNCTGEVYVVSPDDIPSSDTVAAILRYPMPEVVPSA